MQCGIRKQFSISKTKMGLVMERHQKSSIVILVLWVHTISVVDYVSNILNKFKPDTVLMKMDIEGAEYEVLPALEENGLLCANKIQAMTIEYHWRFTKYSKKWSVPNTFHCDKKTKFIELDSEDYVKDGKPL